MTEYFIACELSGQGVFERISPMLTKLKITHWPDQGWRMGVRGEEKIVDIAWCVIKHIDSDANRTEKREL